MSIIYLFFVNNEKIFTCCLIIDNNDDDEDFAGTVWRPGALPAKGWGVLPGHLEGSSGEQVAAASAASSQCGRVWSSMSLRRWAPVPLELGRQYGLSWIFNPGWELGKLPESSKLSWDDTTYFEELL